MSAVSGKGRQLIGTGRDRDLRRNLLEFRGTIWEAVVDYVLGVQLVDFDWASSGDLAGIEEWTFSTDGDMDTQPSVDTQNHQLQIGATGTTAQYFSNLREAQTMPQTGGWGVSHVRTTFWGPQVFTPHPPNTVACQHGVVLRAQQDVRRRAIIVWHDIIFLAPHVINVGVWQGNLDGTGFGNRQGTAVMNGLLETWSWTSATRTSMVVTLNGVTPDPTTRIIVGDRLHVTDSVGSTFDVDGIVTGFTSNTITFLQKWPTSSADQGTPINNGTATRVFPYDVEVLVEGTYVSVRCAHTGDTFPDWDAVDDRVFRYDLESASAGEKANVPTPRGTGRIGFVSSHVGYDPLSYARYGPFYGDNSVTSTLVDVDQAVETETAGAVRASHARTIGQAVETESAQQVTATKARLAAQVVEQELAQSVGRVKSRALGQVVEEELGQPVSSLRVVNQAAETEVAQPIAASKSRALGQVVETESAAAVTGTKTLVAGQSVEQETAQSFSRLKVLAFGQVVEQEVAHAVARTKTASFAQVVEQEAAQAISSAPPVPITGPIRVAYTERSFAATHQEPVFAATHRERAAAAYQEGQ